MQKFKDIFEGNNSAYGQLILSGETTDKGKAVGKAFIKRESIPDQLWKEHIEGKEPALGVIPINEDNMCRWGCIDVDEYNLSHQKIIDDVKKAKFPLVTFRSKSGGAHLFLFAKEFIPASLMQSKLKMMSEALGFGGSEIFPKQTEILVERGDTGNFLNLPYHGDTLGFRYTFLENGEEASLEEFYKIYDDSVQTKAQIESIVVKGKVVKEEAFKDGPPCLNKLADEGFGEGSRNNALFNVAVYHKQANPDNWEDKVMEDNTKWMNPPLNYKEVQALLVSVNKRGYDKYRCKDQPICGVCNAAKCRTKRFGVGFEEEQMPEMDTLSKIASNPPQWFLNVDGKRIELKTEQLYSSPLFALACLDQANLVVPVPKPKDWKQHFLKPLMQNLQEVEPLVSLNPTNEITGLLQDWIINRQSARTIDDIFNKLPFTEDGFTYFRMEDFYAFLKKNNWDMDKIKTGNLIKRLDGIFVEETRLRVKSQQPRVIKIKTMKKLEASVSKVPYQQEDF